MTDIDTVKASLESILDCVKSTGQIVENPKSIVILSASLDTLANLLPSHVRLVVRSQEEIDNGDALNAINHLKEDLFIALHELIITPLLVKKRNGEFTRNECFSIYKSLYKIWCGRQLLADVKHKNLTIKRLEVALLIFWLHVIENHAKKLRDLYDVTPYKFWNNQLAVNRVVAIYSDRKLKLNNSKFETEIYHIIRGANDAKKELRSHG